MDNRLQLVHDWLEKDLGLKNISIQPASADASFRRYFRYQLHERSVVAMDAPTETEDCRAFVNVARRLADCQVNVPIILAQDFQNGFLLLSDLGHQTYLDAITEENASPLYSDAIDTLIRIQKQAKRFYATSLFLPTSTKVHAPAIFQVIRQKAPGTTKS